MYVITFYSFKGGVGRTMALVNVAAELARRGRKVLVVDFDLEAPGLETYQHLRPPKPHPGIVEYVTEFRRNYEVPNLPDYVYETKPIGKKGGHLWVMPAGRRDRAYRQALTKLDWQRLYEKESGFLLFEDTKKGWEVEFNPDYVLIDSRTGDTDVLGICTRQLPDSVVLMFAPNEQNLVGLEGVCRDIRREETEGLQKFIQLHFVAANVPNLDDEKHILRRQMQAFRDRLEFNKLSGVIRRYENLNLLDQSIFALDRPYTRLARSYRRLLRTLLKDNVLDWDGCLAFLQDYPERRKTRIEGTSRINCAHPAFLRVKSSDRGQILVPDGQGGLVPSVAQAEDKKRLREIAAHFITDAEILNIVAECFLLEDDLKSALQMFDHALRCEPWFADVLLLRRADCKINLGLIEDAAEDLLACLRAPISRSLVRHLRPFAQVLYDENTEPPSTSGMRGFALHKLNAIAPKRMFDVADMLETRGMDGVALDDVASYLCETEKGIARAARLLRSVDNPSSFDAYIHLKARCWKEVIRQHEAPGVEETGASFILELALAQWGENGELPESLCKQALQAMDDQFRDEWGLEAVGLLLWRAGQVTEALQAIENAEQSARARIRARQGILTIDDMNLFSLWRISYVSIGQYFDDCRLWRRLFQGESLRPAFLGPVHDPSPT